MRHCNPSDEKTFPMVVFGNKADMTEERKIKKEQIEEWCEENYDVLYIETSAKANQNVEDGFFRLIELGLKQEGAKSIPEPEKAAKA